MDHLVTRPDLDNERLGYYSYSLGAFFGPIPMAVEAVRDRFVWLGKCSDLFDDRLGDLVIR